MFEETRAIFIYCVSPVHMGAGTAIGTIDNPIQRERHTDYPTMAGSGLKGAVRHHAVSSGAPALLVNRIFGPEVQASDHAGAISFSDAQLVAFPVRSLRRAFVYATSSTALARTGRALAIAGHTLGWHIGEDPGAGRCRVINKGLLIDNRLTLEAFQFEAELDDGLRAIGEWLCEHALPGNPETEADPYGFFREKLKTDLVLLSDEDFGFFVRNATVVEPHVRIDDSTGTADDGGLFYTENLPPESLLLTLLMASRERRSNNPRVEKGKDPDGAPADQVLTAREIVELVVEGRSGPHTWSWKLDGALLQVGGDATTGRGHVILRAVSRPPSGGK
jgi:CRISPR-associated protein Cmr4